MICPVEKTCMVKHHEVMTFPGLVDQKSADTSHSAAYRAYYLRWVVFTLSCAVYYLGSFFFLFFFKDLFIYF